MKQQSSEKSNGAKETRCKGEARGSQRAVGAGRDDWWGRGGLRGGLDGGGGRDDHRRGWRGRNFGDHGVGVGDNNGGVVGHSGGTAVSDGCCDVDLLGEGDRQGRPDGLDVGHGRGNGVSLSDVDGVSFRDGGDDSLWASHGLVNAGNLVRGGLIGDNGGLRLGDLNSGVDRRRHLLGHYRGCCVVLVGCGASLRDGLGDGANSGLVMSVKSRYATPNRRETYCR
jgi:hypothetical protein